MPQLTFLRPNCVWFPQCEPRHQGLIPPLDVELLGQHSWGGSLSFSDQAIKHNLLTFGILGILW